MEGIAMPRIKVIFFLAADSFDIEEVTKIMKIQPMRTRKKKDWPIGTINAGFASDIWEIRTEEEECKAVRWQFEKIMRELFGRTKTINDLRRELNLKTGVVVVIKSKVGDFPEMVLTQEIISFAASINADIGFDMYID